MTFDLIMSEWIEIGKIVAAQGLDGELRVYPNSDFPERFLEPGQRWLLRPGQTEPQSIELVGGRYVPGKGLYVVELAGVEDREQAEVLRDSLLLIQRGDRPPLAEDEFYVPDLIGLTVIDQASGETIGRVVGMISAGNDLLEVEKISTDTIVVSENEQPKEQQQNLGRKQKQKQKQKPQLTKTKTILIPFVKEIVPVVDFEQGLIEITPPEGLIEL